MTKFNERKTGMKKVSSIIDNRFLKSTNVQPTLKPIFDYLSDKCFQVEGKQLYRYVLKSTQEIIKTASITELRKRMKIEYCGDYVNGYAISAEIIDTYIDSLLMTVDGDMAMPLAGPIASINNRYYLNKFVDNAIINNDPVDAYDRALLDEYLAIMARGNFNITEYNMDYDRFVDIVVNRQFEKGSKEELVNFFFSWISGLYHRPGLSYPTVPCFFGRKHGTGKGTMATILTRILGNSLSNVSQSRAGDKFNSITDGKLLVVYNEVAEHKGFYNDIIKGTNSEETRIVESKGLDSIEVINITNMLLFSNNLTPFKIDQGDRRLVVIQTLNDDSYDMAKDFHEFHVKFGHDIVDDLAVSMVKIIRDIDYTQCTNLHHAIKTDAKDLMEDSYKSPVERFFSDMDVKFMDLTKSKSQARRTSIKKLETLFSNWINDVDESGLRNVRENYEKTNEAFSTELKKMATERSCIEQVSKGDYAFTDTFYEKYNTYHQNHSEVVTTVDFQSRIKRLQGAN